MLFFPRAVFRSHNLTISICLVCFPCTLLPAPSRACWRPPCCRPRTDHSTRYHAGPLRPPHPAPRRRIPFLRGQPLRIATLDEFKTLLSLRFPLHFISQVPIRWLFFFFSFLSVPFETMKRSPSNAWDFFFFLFLSGESSRDPIFPQKMETYTDVDSSWCRSVTSRNTLFLPFLFGAYPYFPSVSS